jgi:hypothetical protein
MEIMARIHSKFQRKMFSNENLLSLPIKCEDINDIFQKSNVPKFACISRRCEGPAI